MKNTTTSPIFAPIVITDLDLSKKEFKSEQKVKKVSLSDKRHAAREIAKSSKIIWHAAKNADFPHLMKLSECLFYEAFVAAGVTLDLDRAARM
jgi:hypothetical protein